MHTKDLLKTGAQWLVVLILLVAALPVMALGAWVLRAALVVAVILALFSGCILYCVHPRFRDWTRHLGRHNEASS